MISALFSLSHLGFQFQLIAVTFDPIMYNLTSASLVQALSLQFEFSLLRSSALFLCFCLLHRSLKTLRLCFTPRDSSGLLVFSKNSYILRSLSLSLSAFADSSTLQTGQRKMEQTQQQQSQISDFKLLPGFRFTPTDEELVGFYLYNHIFGVSLQNISFCALSFCDLFGSEEPWEIWAKAQPTRLGLSTGDVYLITKVKKATTANGNGSRFGRGVGTTGGRWHESGKFPFKVPRESQELDGVRRKFSYQNTKSTEHMCWIMYEYAVSFDGGNTFSEDVICMLRNNGSSLFPEPNSGKKRKFEGCTGSSSLPPKLPKVSATSALLLVPDSCDKDVQPIAPTIQDEASGQTGHQLVHSDGFLLHPQVETSSTVAMQQVPYDLSFDSFLSTTNINSELQILTYQEQVPTLSTHIDDHYVFDGVFIDDKLAHSTWAPIEDEAGHKGVQLEQEVEPPVKTVEHVPSPDSTLNPVSFEYALSSDWLPDDDFFNCDPNPSCVPCSVGTNLIDESDDVLLYNSYPVQTGHQLVHSDGFLLHPQVENSSTAAMQQVPSYLSFDSFLSNTNINSELQIATYQEQVPTLSTHIDDHYVSDGVFIDDKLAHSTWALTEDDAGHKGVQLEQEVEPPVKTFEHVPSPDSALNPISFEYALSSDWLPDDDFFNCDPNPSCVPCSVGTNLIDESDDVLLYNSYPIQTGHQLVHSDGFLLHPQVETSSTAAMQQVPSYLSFDSFLSNTNINSELQIATYQEQVPTLSMLIDYHYVSDGVFIDDKLAHSTWALIEDEAGHKGVQLEQDVEPPVKTVEHVPSPDSALNPISFEYALSSDWLPAVDFFNCDPNPSCVPCSVGTNLIDESDDVLLYNSYPMNPFVDFPYLLP